MTTFVPSYFCSAGTTKPLVRNILKGSFTTRVVAFRNQRCAPLHRSGFSSRQTFPFSPICFNEGPRDDGDFDEEDEPQVTLCDPVTRRSITVGIEEAFDFEGISHILCYPIDDPVAFVENNHDGKLHPVLDDNKIADIYPSAKAICAEHHIELKNTAYFMTAEDDSDIMLEENADDEDDDKDDKDDEDDEDNEDDEDEIDESVEVIAEFSHKDKDYMVIRPFQTVWIVAREEKDSYKVIKDEQLERVRPMIENILSERDLSQ